MELYRKVPSKSDDPDLLAPLSGVPSRVVILSWDGTTPGESFCLETERLQGSHSVLGWNDSRGVILSWDGSTPEDSFCPGIERLQGSHSVLEWNDSS